MSEGDTVKVGLELPKDNNLVKEALEEQSNEMKEEKPKSNPEAEVAKLKKELASNRQKLETDDASEGPQNTATPILEKLLTVRDKTPPNKHQRMVVVAGLALAVAGFCLWPLTNFWLGLATATVGAVVVASGTFIKV